MPISYQKHGDLIYGTVCTVRREGKKVVKEYGAHLGRVVDKERLVFFNKKHGGLFQYDEETGSFLPPPDDVQVPVRKSRLKVPAKPVSFSFGAVYLIDSFLKKIGFYKVIEDAFADKSDAVKAMISFYILSSLNNSYSADWLQCNIGSLLFPKASLSGTKVRSLLKYIGDLNRKQLFLISYLEWLRKYSTEDKAESILIDSTGLPDSVHFDLTAISNHDEEINEEARLIYVVQQTTGLPLFFRAIPGNSIDVTTVQRVLEELNALGVEVTYTVADAGYYSDDNLKTLFNNGINFLLPVQPNRTLYNNIVARHLSTIEKEGTLVKHNNRLVRVQQIQCKLCEKKNTKGEIIEQGFDGYAYLCVDEQRKALELLHLGDRVTRDNLSIEQYDKEQQGLGVFMLVSSECIAVQEVLAVYYTRHQIEQDFGLRKNYDSMLPLNIQKEGMFNGHMMLTFLATIVVKLLQNSLKGIKTPVRAILEILEHHNCVKDGDTFITCEPNEKAREAYDALGIEYPISIRLK